MFKLRLCANAIWCKISVMQQIDMKLPYQCIKEDIYMFVTFVMDMSLSQVKENNLEETFRSESVKTEKVALRNSEDVENILIPISRIVEVWESPLGGNWIGRIPFSSENYAFFKTYFGL